MRTIKFRGKSTIEVGEKIINIGDWIYGGISMDYDRVWIDTEYYGQIIVDKETVGQFTGLYDKNGKEIYEGDIVLYEDWEMATENGSGDSFINKGIVEYCEENCRFYVTEKQTILDEDVFYEGNEDLEVIGDIYDNKNLLGGIKHE